MDRRLLRYTERELQYLREMGQEFAREFPAVAGRLALDVVPCPDPYVERLMEAFAFLAARVHLKLDAEFPRFTQNLLETVYPNYLGPTPSMTVVEFQPDLNEGALAEGYHVPRQTVLRSLLGRGEQTPREYRTAHDVTLWPIRVTEAGYFTRNLAALDVPAGGAVAGIRLRLECTAGLTFDKVKLDNLVLYLKGSGDLQTRLYEQIFAHGHSVVVQPRVRPVPWRHVVPAAKRGGGGAIRRVGFEENQALLPVTARSFEGYRLLHEYFALPDRFLFVELAGLAPGVRQCKATELEIVILLRERDLALENAVSAANFVPHCTPAINLFPKRADRIQLTDRFHEFQVMPDKTRMRDFEVYQVTRLVGHGSRPDEEHEFYPFYSARDAYQDRARAYYTVQRVPRLPSEKERRFGQRSNYAGSEVYVSLVDASAAPYSTDLKQLSVETLCTNRDLPQFMQVGRGQTDFTMESGAPVESVRCASGVPTAPRPSALHAEENQEGEQTWRAISHMALNYLSLCDTDTHQGAAALRDLLRLYADTSKPHIRKQIEGVRSVTSKPITRRVVSSGPIAFARGLEVTVTFDELMFEGTGVFVLGAVLDHFFAKYVSINSFTETVVRCQEKRGGDAMAGEDWQAASPLDPFDDVGYADEAEYGFTGAAAPTGGPQSAVGPGTGGAAQAASAAAEPPPSAAASTTDAAPPADTFAQLLAALQEDPYPFDFFQIVRRIECSRRDMPPIGHATRPSQEPVRFGQVPSLAFAPSTLSGFVPADEERDRPPRLFANFLGLLGPNGPLPFHLTEYARDRERNHGDPATARFFDLFNHRILALFYRAWACNHMAVTFERGEGDRFAVYVASLFGMGLPSLRNRDSVPDVAKLHYSGRLACQTRHASGLRAVIADYFGIEADVEEFVGQWIDIPPDSHCRLGGSPDTGRLGLTAIVGSKTWDCQQKFRLRLGPMTLADYKRLLPGGDSLRRLMAWVKNYAGEEYDWDVRFVLQADEVPRVTLGGGTQLGWTTWVWSRTIEQDQDSLVLQQSAAKVVSPPAPRRAG